MIITIIQSITSLIPTLAYIIGGCYVVNKSKGRVVEIKFKDFTLKIKD